MTGRQPEPPDGELLRRIANGDQQAFNQLLGRHGKTIRALAHGMLGRPEETEEVLQEVSIKIWRNAHRWRSDGAARFSTWLHRVTLNASLDRRRQRGQEPMEEALEIADAAPPAWETVLSAQRSAILRRALTTLPARQRMVLSLHYFDQLTAGQIALRLGLTLIASQALLARGKARLRRALRQAGLTRPGDLL